MNEKKAKKLRKYIFGDRSFKAPREYLALFFDKKMKKEELPGGRIAVYIPFTVILKPDTPFAYYRAAKRAFARHAA